MNSKENSNRFIISDKPSEEETKLVKNGLEDYNKNFPNGELDVPTPDICLVLRDKHENIVGGVITSMLTGIMHLEVLWIDEKYRGRGYGRNLILHAEKIGKQKNYSASQTWTFSFQAPDFYQNIGYKVIGIFEGYTGGITEYILLKKFESNNQTPYQVKESNRDGFTISEDKSTNSMKILHEGLHKFVTKHVGGLRKENPEIKISLVLKNDDGRVFGGLLAYTTLRALHIVRIWVDEDYRNQGYGRELLTTAERIAKKNHCISGLLNVLSFQCPDFFQKFGYEIFGISDGYPDSIRENFLIKKF